MRPRNPEKGLVQVGRRIGEIRRERGWTQEQFAERAGISSHHAQQIEYGKINLPLVTLFRLSNVLQIPASSLLVAPSRREAWPSGRPKGQESKVPGSYRASKYIGVFWRSGSWRAKMMHQGRMHYLGPFARELDAARGYDAMARELKGETAPLNFPDAV